MRTPKANSAKTDASVIAKYFATAFLLVAIAIMIFIKCPTKGQYFVVYALIGVAISLFFIRSAEKSLLWYKRNDLKISLSGAIVIPVLLLLTNPLAGIKEDLCTRKQSLTVFVHGKKGYYELPLRGMGEVVMDIGGERKKEPINEKGQAFFQNLQAGDRVKLSIDFSEPYTSLYPDSVFVITEEGVIYLPVILPGIDKVHGHILYREEPLEGVHVAIGQLSSVTDSSGRYVINIPDSLQNKEYRVQLSKPGFKSVPLVAKPQSGLPLDYVMEK